MRVMYTKTQYHKYHIYDGQCVLCEVLIQT